MYFSGDFQVYARCCTDIIEKNLRQGLYYDFVVDTFVQSPHLGDKCPNKCQKTNTISYFQYVH